MLFLPNSSSGRIVASHAIGPGPIPGLGTLGHLYDGSGLIVKWLRRGILIDRFLPKPGFNSQ